MKMTIVKTAWFMVFALSNIGFIVNHNIHSTDIYLISALIACAVLSIIHTRGEDNKN